MMIRNRYRAASLSLIVILAIGLIPKTIGAEGGGLDDDRPIRLYATALTGPIGAIEDNGVGRGRLAINGRITHGEQLIWGGELLQAPANANARVSFDWIGCVTLGSGAVARFSATSNGSADNVGRVLIASIINGDLKVRLQPDASAYIQAGGTAFRASRGADFRIGIREGQVVVDIVSGRVSPVEQQPQRRYVLRPVGVGATISVRARATRQIQIQVTDENDRPVPDVPIIFALGGGGGSFAGSLGAAAAVATSTTVNTNAQGIATATFTAGPSAGSNTITATIEGTNISWTATINVVAGVGFWTVRNRVLVVSAAAAVGGGLAFALNNKKEEVRPLPPPQVRP